MYLLSPLDYLLHPVTHLSKGGIKTLQSGTLQLRGASGGEGRTGVRPSCLPLWLAFWAEGFPPLQVTTVTKGTASCLLPPRGGQPHCRSWTGTRLPLPPTALPALCPALPPGLRRLPSPGIVLLLSPTKSCSEHKLQISPLTQRSKGKLSLSFLNIWTA